MPSQVFTLRLWMEETGKDSAEWRGEARHVTSGAVRYFRDWGTLVEFIQATLPPVDHFAESTSSLEQKRRQP